MVQQIVLPGNLTGRSKDRYFQCLQLPSMPRWVEGDWPNYLYKALDHIDFIEVPEERFNAFGDLREGEER